MKKIMFFVFYIIISIMALSYIKLYDGWEYKWEDETTWHKYETPGIPLENKGEMLYLRHKLPDIKLENPAVYLTGIFDNSSMYVGDIEIYNTFGKSFFSPKSIFKIPNDFQNKYLIIRVSSSRKDVGFFGEFLLGNEMELLTHQIIVELDKILLVIFSFFVLTISLIIYLFFLLHQRNSEVRKSFLFLSIFSLGIGLFISGQTQTFKYFFPNNVFWSYVMDLGKYISPIGIMGFFYNVFDYSTKKVIKWLIIYHIIYFAIVSGIQVMNGYEYNYYVIYVLGLYFSLLIDIVVMLYNLYIGFKLKDHKAYILSVAIIIVSAFAIYEILGDFRVIKWERPLIQWSIFILINSMIFLILRNIKELNLELSVKNKILENWNKELEKEVSKRTKDIRVLLDNSGEGFLSFDKNLIVGNEYSKECNKIFGKNIEGTNILDLMFLNYDKDFIKRVLNDLFNEKEKIKKEVYISFLPSEIKINYGYYKVDYKYIDHEDVVMVILKDITSEKELRIKVNEEKENLEKIVTIVRNYEAFVYNIKSFKKMLDELKNILNEDENELYRNVHNFKGIFSQFHLNKISNALHNIENKILVNNLNEDDIIGLYNIFEKEIHELKEELGHEIEEDILRIPKSKIYELEFKMKQVLNENSELIKEIKKLRYKSLKKLLYPYISYSKELAKKLGKVINDPKIISREEISIDPEKYFDFVKSLINIFRNIIVHGIEIPEVRIANEKNEGGNIRVEIYKEKSKINIMIEDDGQGIDVEKLKQIAKIKNIEYNSEEDLLNIIFLDYITTSKEATQLSGRGMGLSIVKKEVEKLGGIIRVTSEYNKGTKFHIIIPEVI
ncbi:ATP-binding protein [Marinitoga aeolica]|uniref:histidine kinase n=1 Tax=Marinitoga aeolica TaxID=2809031 RepID=A0ABY8PSP7_9BACT|nr:ATP-binding protein [Marinitoga aeolica]WGS65642.1 hypothetical protein JRV97_03560 [Marinitoga aeolica]